MEKAPVGRPKGADLENSARRRKQLVDAAVTSIVEHGLSSTTLATVAKASGLSQGTAVFYFKTKDALLSEAFQHRMEEYQEACRDAMLAAGDDPVHRIIAVAFASLDPTIMSRDNLALWSEFWPEASRSKTLNAAFLHLEAERQEVMRHMFEDARGMIETPAWTAETAAQTVETMVEGIWKRLHYSANHISFDVAINMMCLLLGTIFPGYRDAITKAANNVRTTPNSGD